MAFADRRSVLAGLAAIGTAGCGPAQETGSETLGSRPAVPYPTAFDLSALEADNGGRLGFVAMDTGSTRTLGWRHDERFVYCSTFKMFLAACVLEKARMGGSPMGKPIPITRADMISHAPVTGPAVGGALTLEQLCQATVEVSDNPAANLLLREIGGLGVMRDFYRSMGDQLTRVDRYEPEMNRLDGDKDTAVPLRIVENLKSLFIHPLPRLSDDPRRTLLGWMFDSPTGMDRIKAGVPAGWRVAHKTGTGGYGPTNDIGILYPPSGEPVIVAAYYHAARETTDAQNAAVIAQATRLALTALGRA